MSKKYPSKIDVAVLLLFFNRPYTLNQVFQQIKIARPSRLYLFQDGARSGRPDDLDNIQKCRDIVKNIDWECTVYTNYQQQNNGCDPAEYLAQKWMFETEEMGIILEDDDVPSQSFFPFCKELLEKYKDDQRINMICGMNNLETYDCPYDYVFTTKETITGWASWKRVIDEWSARVDFVNDPYYIEKYRDLFKRDLEVNKQIKRYKHQNEEGIAYYESILSATAKMNHRLNIVPCKNLISNIGNIGETTHGVSDVNLLPRGIRKIFNMKTYEYDFPLNHPKYVIEDMKYTRCLYRVMGEKHPLVQLWRRCESVFLRIKAGQTQQVCGSLIRKIKGD